MNKLNKKTKGILERDSRMNTHIVYIYVQNIKKIYDTEWLG